MAIARLSSSSPQETARNIVHGGSGESARLGTGSIIGVSIPGFLDMCLGTECDAMRGYGSPSSARRQSA